MHTTPPPPGGGGHDDRAVFHGISSGDGKTSLKGTSTSEQPTVTGRQSLRTAEYDAMTTRDESVHSGPSPTLASKSKDPGLNESGKPKPGRRKKKKGQEESPELPYITPTNPLEHPFIGAPKAEDPAWNCRLYDGHDETPKTHKTPKNLKTSKAPKTRFERLRDASKNPSVDACRLAAEVLLDVFRKSRMKFAFMGGYALYLRGNSRQPNSVDITVPEWTIWRALAALRKSEQVCIAESIFKTFKATVFVAGSLEEYPPPLVRVDIIVAGSLSMPSNLPLFIEHIVPEQGWLLKDDPPVLEVDSQVFAKLHAHNDREHDTNVDMLDLFWLMRKYETTISKEPKFYFIEHLFVFWESAKTQSHDDGEFVKRVFNVVDTDPVLDTPESPELARPEVSTECQTHENGKGKKKHKEPSKTQKPDKPRVASKPRKRVRNGKDSSKKTSTSPDASEPMRPATFENKTGQRDTKADKVTKSRRPSKARRLSLPKKVTWNDKVEQFPPRDDHRIDKSFTPERAITPAAHVKREGKVTIEMLTTDTNPHNHALEQGHFVAPNVPTAYSSHIPSQPYHLLPVPASDTDMLVEMNMLQDMMGQDETMEERDDPHPTTTMSYPYSSGYTMDSHDYGFTQPRPDMPAPMSMSGSHDATMLDTFDKRESLGSHDMARSGRSISEMMNISDSSLLLQEPFESFEMRMREQSVTSQRPTGHNEWQQLQLLADATKKMN